MNYERTVLLEQLAADYVVGSLRGRARARFERLCKESALALQARHWWEDRLLPIALSLAPVAPRTDLLPAIRAKLNVAAAAGGDATTPAVGSRRWWPLAAAASVLVVLGLLTRLMFFPATTWQPMATLALANAPAWAVERVADNSRLRIRTLPGATPLTASDYELWLLPTTAGASPVSLGVTPRQGDQVVELNAAQQALMATVTTLAVTLEPVGGSPTGLPTGAVVTTAAVTRV
jgi:anti-sigma-K factor RskA